jgi:hypothetical protein
LQQPGDGEAKRDWKQQSQNEQTDLAAPARAGKNSESHRLYAAAQRARFDGSGFQFVEGLVDPRESKGARKFLELTFQLRILCEKLSEVIDETGDCSLLFLALRLLGS